MTVAGATIAEVAARTVDELPGVLDELAGRSERPAVARAVVEAMRAWLAVLAALGLGHLALSRGAEDGGGSIRQASA